MGFLKIWNKNVYIMKYSQTFALDNLTGIAVKISSITSDGKWSQIYKPRKFLAFF